MFLILVKCFWGEKGAPSMCTRTAHAALEKSEKPPIFGEFSSARDVPFGCTYWGWGEVPQTPQDGIYIIFQYQLLTRKIKKAMDI